jgi:integrase
MKARKLPSGKWNVQVLDYMDENGKMHKRSFTAATKIEAESKAAAFKFERTEGGQDGAVADMVERAIRQKAPALSPSTLRGYKKILEQQIKPSPIAKARVSVISSAHLQKWIGWMLGNGLSPKSIKNAYGLFTSCYQFMGGEKVFRVKLPQASAVRKHVPSIADVQAVMEYFASDPDMTAAIRLCAFASLRRGEVCALTAKDVDRKRKTIRVNKAVTETADGEWITKVPKTASSVRVVPVSQFVLDALPTSGKCVNIPPAQVTNRFCRAIEKLKEQGIAPFSFHDLRHFYASLAHNKGVSDITIQAAAGWSSAATMKSIYWGEIGEETREQTDKLNNYVDSAFRLGV